MAVTSDTGIRGIVRLTVGQDGTGNDVTPQVSHPRARAMIIDTTRDSVAGAALECWKGNEGLVLLAYTTAYHLACLHTPA